MREAFTPKSSSNLSIIFSLYGKGSRSKAQGQRLKVKGQRSKIGDAGRPWNAEVGNT